MSGKIHTLLNSVQPTHHGNTSPSIDKLPSQPSPLLNPRPTGAIHPAFLTPISTGQATTYPYPQPSPSSQHYTRRSPSSHDRFQRPSWLTINHYSPTSSSADRYPQPQHTNGVNPIHSPTRSTSSSVSSGLHGLADVAMMDVDRRSPGMKGLHVNQESGRRFWNDGAKGGESESINTWPFVDRPSTSGRPLLHREHTNPTPPYSAQNHHSTSAPVSRLQSPTRPTTAGSLAPNHHRASHQPSSTLPTSPAAAPVPRKINLTVAKAPTHKLPVFGPELPHPLLNVNLDREYNPPTTEEWERRALRVLQLPRIPLSMRQPPAPIVPDPQPKPITPPMTAISNPPSPVSSVNPAEKSTRAKRGGDRRPRATPHSATWAEEASKIVTQDEAGRRIHPPPGGIIPPPANGRGSYLPDLLTTSTPPLTDPSGYFETFTADRRAAVRSSQQNDGSDSSRSSRGSGAGGEGLQESGDGAERMDGRGGRVESEKRTEARGVQYSDAEVDTAMKLNFRLQSQQDESTQTIDRLRHELSERDEEIVKLREKLAVAELKMAEK